MNAYEIPDAIQWHEGLLLTPQHFQQMSSRHEALVQYGNLMVSPFGWGVRRFKHHAISLPAGKLRVLELEAVMPDGLVVVHGRQGPERDGVLEIDLAAHAEHMGHGGALVHVAVPARLNGNGDSARYEPFKGGLVADEISAGKPRPIHRLKPRLSLHVGDKVPGDHLGFPLARVIYRDSSFTFDENFIPPLLAVPIKATDGDASSIAAQRLGEMCSEMAQRVRKRAMYLADEARTPSASHRFGGALEIRTLMHSLVGALPGFEAVLQSGCAHPYLVYVALCNMAGQLAVLGTEMVPPAFNCYEHNDLYATFRPVLDFIDRSMDQGVPVSYKTFPFRYHEGAYELRFEGTWMKKRLAIGMKGERGMSEAEVVRWGESCLIGSQNRIDLLKANRVRGASRKHSERVGDVVISKDMALFSLIVDESFVEPEKLLQIINREGPRPCEIILYVMDN
ncbi:MAG TPA: type VI secretion system baseplate subunit TssK [Pyrinomonadaceae bacterium]|nr:type VI secretion system baseplate subunit TssK [Pyrinomonadaceae bacterium]